MFLNPSTSTFSGKQLNPQQWGGKPMWVVELVSATHRRRADKQKYVEWPEESEVYNTWVAWKVMPHFIMLLHDDRCGYCWQSSRGWTFPPIFCNIYLPCNRHSDKMVSDIEECMKKRRGCAFLPVKKWHPLTFSDSCWMLVETKQWMWAS